MQDPQHLLIPQENRNCHWVVEKESDLFHQKPDWSVINIYGRCANETENLVPLCVVSLGIIRF